MRKLLPSVAVTFAAAALALPGHATTLLGSTVTGSIQFGTNTNYYDPANGHVPTTGYENSSTVDNSPTVTVTPSIEFGFQDPTDLDVTNISADGLLFRDTFSGTGGTNPFTLTFADTAFFGLSLKELSNTFPNSFTYSLVGDVISISSPGVSTSVPGQTDVVTFSIATPEPGSLVLMGSGMLGVAAAGLRRRRVA